MLLKPMCLLEPDFDVTLLVMTLICIYTLCVMHAVLTVTEAKVMMAVHVSRMSW